MRTRDVNLPAIRVVLNASHPVGFPDARHCCVHDLEERLDGRSQSSLVPMVQALQLRLPRVAQQTHVHLLGHLASLEPVLEVSPTLHNVGSVPPSQVHIERGDIWRRGKRLESEGGDDAKVGPGTAKGPEQIRVLGFRGVNRSAVGEHNGRFVYPIHGQAVGV